MVRYCRRGFTLVELLVVISIIGVLIALLLPAVQAAREAGRRTQCKNNLKQIGLAVTQHVEKQGFFPTGGWGFNWAGDPDRGFTKKQPAGWCYNILPFMDMQTLHDLGKNQTNVNTKKTLGAQAAQTPLAFYTCPTRRAVEALPLLSSSYVNITLTTPTTIGRCDYAMCAGAAAYDKSKNPPVLLNPPLGGGVPTAGPPITILTQGEGTYSWPNPGPTDNGVSYVRSEIQTAHVRDGLSCTYLVGEKYVAPEHYVDGNAAGDRRGWNVGFAEDIYRWARTDLMPARDKANNIMANQQWVFGSAHSAGWHVVLCDGSVHAMNWALDADVHRRLGSRNDGEAVDQSQIP